jgi:radical SAM superfamily enzyme YgiQ (UPF0313 family)
MDERKRVLVVCTHLRRDRSKRACHDFLQPITGLHIAAHIDSRKYDIVLHHEDWHGSYDPLSDSDFQLAFLTGLHADFDRMRQLSYYLRRSGARVVAGGNLCTLFPEFASEFFDSVCAGGVENVTDFMADYEAGCIKKIYRKPQTHVTPYDLDYSLFTRYGISPPVHFIEASRGCSFKCSFCVIPAEGAAHSTYSPEALEQAISSAIDTSPRFNIRRHYPVLWFVDNNFSDNREYAKAVCRSLRDNKRVRAWGALVTQNIFRDHNFMRFLYEHKCRILFTGLESLNLQFLMAHNKKQNVSRQSSITDDIRFAERQGFVVTYAYLFDPRVSSVADMRRQVRTLTEISGFPMPAFFSFVSPLVGTRLFWESFNNGELRPGLRLRDLDGEAIAYTNLVDELPEVVEFARTLSSRPHTLISLGRLFVSTLSRIWNARCINPFLWQVFFKSNFRPYLIGRSYRLVDGRNYTGAEDILDPQYHEFPEDISEDDRHRYFEPIRVLESDGELAHWLRSYAPVQVCEAPSQNERRVALP